MAKHINLFGGPSSGKSTSAAGLFYEMKIQKYKVEYCTEYAKDLVYSNDTTKLDDQLMVLAQQHHKTLVLDSQVDYVINDGFFLLSCIYVKDKPHLDIELFKKLVISIFKSYDTINIVLKVKEENYQDYGRTQTFEESLEIHNQIIELLEENDIKFIELEVDKNTINGILSLI